MAALHGLYLLFFLLFCISQQCSALTNPQDAAILMALRDQWSSSLLQPWKPGDPCASQWLGVTCDARKSQVISLVLTSMRLSGRLPPDIGNLTNLNVLDLSFNDLSGQLPKQLGNLQKLNSLSIQECSLSGSIPSELGSLRNLTFLALNGNRLTGSIPHTIGYLTKLYWLDLAFNQLSGPLPVSTDSNNLAVGLDNLTAANHFHLNGNAFNGTIPAAIFNTKMSLIHLLLDSNRLEGQIPEEINLLQHIDILKLDNNHLSGAIPSGISELVTLSELYLSSNQLTGGVPDLTALNNLQVLDLSNNRFEASPVPSWFSSFRGITSLTMQRGNLNGSLSPIIFDLPQLQVLNLDYNSIYGTLTIDSSSDQLLLVSLQYNDISATNLRGYDGNLLLQGNPVCKLPTNLPAKACSLSSIEPWRPPASSCPRVCTGGLKQNPNLCICADPYEGYFFFRAPKFTIINATQVQDLTNVVSAPLNLSPSQVLVTGASFLRSGGLTVNISFFPTNDKETWSQSDIQRFSSAVTNVKSVIKYPPQFGPPLFVAYPYNFVLSSGGSGLSTGAKIGIAVGAAIVVLLLISVSIYATLQKRKAEKAQERSEPFASWGSRGRQSGAAPKLKGARRFSYDELKKATNNFSVENEIGMGGFGKVYKGVLSGGEQVAIKRAMEGSIQGATEFKNEIELLSRVHHKNLVSLVGFCFERGEQMLVYEYMPNGSLRDNLLGRTGLKMDWKRRLMIALGSARGIAYLHELANPPIIHRDIKSSNILLDEKNIAKVADFGLSKVGPDEAGEKAHVSTQVKGTMGYLDPEYYMTQQLTEKSDVYSFGVVLLEIITARQPIEKGRYIVREVKTALNTGGVTKLQLILDPRLDDYPTSELQKFIDLALRCVEETAASRPTMNEVVKELETLIGKDFSDSVNMNVKKCETYTSTSDIMNKEADPSFDYSGGYIMPTTVEPK